MEEWYIIKDIDSFTDKVRAMVYNNFGIWNKTKDESDDITGVVSEEEKEEFDKVLSHNESLTIILSLAKKQKHKNTKKERFVINDEIFMTIIQSLNDRMLSNILAGLVNKGIIESSYDNKTNDFVFWIKDENKKFETD